MRVTVTASSWAKRWLPNGTAALNLPNNATALDVLAPLGIPPEEVGLFAINGTAVLKDAQLNDGDVVRVFPIIMGG